MPDDQVVCNDNMTTLITFSTSNTGGSTSYYWENSNINIGLGPNGTGNISPFLATNSTSSPITATISVTPSFTNNNVTCQGSTESFDIIVNPTPQINSVSDQIVCNGEYTDPINFSSPTTGGTISYTWSNNNTNIGLPALGNGDIDSFQAQNTSSSPITADITVTPYFEYGNETCEGDPITFSITVNPGGEMDTPPDQIVCNGEETDPIVFTTSNTGGTTEYYWENNNTDIGLGTNGYGDIPAFTTTNSGTSPITAEITVTPSFTSNGTTCQGNSISFFITVSPTGQVIPVEDQIVCHGEQTSQITFSTSNTGGNTSYTWTNDNISIGLSALGTGNIMPFTANNAGTNPSIANIEVTPTFTYNNVSCQGSPESFTITVNPAGQVNPITDQILCNGEDTAPIVFSTNNTGGNTNYYWTNDNPTIGLSGSGNGDIASFTGNNTGNQPEIATITVTPYFTNTAANCQGDPITFTITIDPIPEITNSIFTKEICTNQKVDIDLLANTGATTIFTWQSDITTPPSGGTIEGTTNCPDSCGSTLNDSLTNTGTTSGMVTYTVTPVFNACIGTSENFEVTVHPSVTLTCTPTAQEICSGSLPDTISIASNVSGATINWTAVASVPGSITGFQPSGTSFTILPQTITSILDYTGTVTYTIIPTVSGCESMGTSHVITVNPAPVVTNDPLRQVKCSEVPTDLVTLTSNVSSPTFTWMRLNTPTNLTGYEDVALPTPVSILPAMTITNTGTTTDSVMYQIIPSFSGTSMNCPGVPVTYTYVVKPSPNGSSDPIRQLICSEDNATIQLESDVIGTSFTFNAISANGHVTGYTTTCQSGCGVTINDNYILDPGYYQPDSVIYTITPNAAGCDGDDFVSTVVVKPNPNVTFGPASTPSICTNETTNIILNSGVASGVSYTWPNPLINPSGSVTGTAPCSTTCGDTIQQQLANIGNVTSTVTYSVTASADGCTGDPNTFDLEVFPVPQVTNSTTDTSICSGQPAGIILISNVTIPAATFSWSATSPNPTYITGFSNASGSVINQPLTNSGTTDGVVIYKVVASANGCEGDTTTFNVTVHPVPYASFSLLPQEICSGETANQVDLSCPVANTTYSWNAVASHPGSITGFDDAGTTNYIPPQTISSTLNVQGTVTFTITPTANGCDGPDSTYVITVNPAPSVTNTPMEQTHCSGQPTTLVTLTSNVQGTTFAWTATPSTPDIEGYITQGTSTIPIQTLTNSGTTTGHVTYEIIPTYPGFSNCPGDTADYIIYVKPLPTLTMAPVDTAICAGDDAIINLSSTITGTTYTWITAQTGGVTGLQNCSGSPIPCGDQISQTLSLNPNTWTPGTATFTITPAYDGCDGSEGDTSIIVKPLPNVNFSPAITAICNGMTTQIALSTDIPTGATYSWTSTLIEGDVNGFNADIGDTIAQTLFNNGYINGIVRYSVVAVSGGCTGDAFTYDVTVYPVPDVSNDPMSKDICSNTSTNILLTSHITGTSFSWTAACPESFIGGYSGGSGLVIDQTLTNTGDVDGVVTYTITPQANGCDGLDTNYLVTVHPVPVAHCDTNGQEICSGSPTDEVILTSNVANTNFDWTGVASSPDISGFTQNGNGSPIPSQPNIISTLTVQGTVTYIVAAEANGCIGISDSHIITVNPAPSVSNNPLYDSICSGETSPQVVLTSTVPLTTFTWEAFPSSASLDGYDASGGDTIPPQTITNTDVVPQTVTYRIVPNFTGITSCPGDTTDYTITVSPKPQITSVLFDSVCSENPFSYTITSSVANSTFNWSRAAVAGISNPASSGNNDLIEETLINTTSNDIDVVYQLLTTGPYTTACQSDPAQLTVRVKDYFVDAGVDFEIPHGISTDLNGAASGGGNDLYFTWQDSTMIQNGLHTLTPHTKNIYQDTTFYLVVTDQTMANCTKTDSVRITLNGSALAVNPFVDPTLVCPGGSAQLFANPSGGSGVYVSFTWTSNPPGTPIWTSQLENPFINPLIPTTYTVIVDDGYNTATGSVSIAIKDPPLIYNVTGGGPYCAGGNGVVIGLDSTNYDHTYRLIGPLGTVVATVSGTNTAITFGTFTAPGTYTATATSASTPQCTSNMASSAIVSIILPPDTFAVQGTGSYSQGGGGIPIWLAGSETGVEYELIFNDTLILPPRVPGDGDSITFGNQTLGGTYKVVAYTLTNPVCTAQMLDSAVIVVNPWPTVYTLLGGGEICADDSTGVPIWLEDSEVSITYRLFHNGTQYGSAIPGSGDSLVFDTINQAGSYWANGTNQITGLMRYMDDTVTIVVHPLPLVYVMGSYGDNCPGTEIMLNGSQQGVNYELQVDQVPIDMMPGTDTVLNFGPQSTAGIYGIRAYNTLTGCDIFMDNPITLNPSPDVFDIWPIGVSCAGNSICLQGSELGIKYQLQLNDSLNVGPSLDGGDGDTLHFGPQFVAGNYTVLAFNPLTNCNILMNGVANLYPIPDPYSVVPSGDTCAGTSIGLSGSQLGVKYILKWDTLWLDSLNGTSFPLEFGPQTIPGIYTIEGYDTTTYNFCSNLMLGSVIIQPNPTPYQIIPMGDACAGDNVGLVHSDTGVVYQLIRNGNQNMGDPVEGTEGPLWFGIQILPGTYTVKGRFLSSNCWGDMIDSTVLTANPTLFTIIPEGDTCSGTPISLNGSQIEVDYTLLIDGDADTTIAGTGSMLHFGPQWLGGTYTIKAINATSDSCDAIMFGSTIIHQLPIAYNVTPAGISCVGESIGLSDSDTGVIYHLVWNGIAQPVTKPGDGGPLDFGPQYIAGVYTVIGITEETNCLAEMNDSATLLQLPTVYTIVHQGDTCANTFIELNGSQLEVKYRLYRFYQSSIFLVDSLDGTGDNLFFGPVPEIGTYTIVAIWASTNICPVNMVGSVTIHLNPTEYRVNPQGPVCGGDSIYLEHSQSGIDYYLQHELYGTIDIIPGTGDSPLNLGYWDVPGVYTVIARDTLAPHCWSEMEDSFTILQLPTVYALIPTGDTCANIQIKLSGSQQDIKYYLKNLSSRVDSAVGDGEPITFDYETTPGTYTVLAKDPSSSPQCEQMMYGSLVVYPRPIAYNLLTESPCEPANLYLYNSQEGVEYRLIQNGVLYGSSWILSETGGMLPLDTVMAGEYQAIGRYPESLCADTMAGTVVITAQPNSFAGNDTSVCYGDSILLSGTATSYDSVHWERIGDGVFSDPDSLVTYYTPGPLDLDRDSVWLILQVTGTVFCNSMVVEDTLLLTIDPLPLVDAGVDDTICEGTPSVQLYGNPQNFSSVKWRTQGDGWFDDSTSDTTFYNTGASDKGIGMVTLTLTAYGDLACSDTAFDSMILHIDPLPIADAGPDDTICENAIPYSLNGSIQNSTSSIWSTPDGTGIIADPTSLNTNYQPSAGDIAAGMIHLVLTANGTGTCDSYSHQDTMRLFFHLLPIIYAGSDDTICSNQYFLLSSATADLADSLLWSALDGDGVFDDPNTLNPTYYPGPTDTTNGSVLLILTAWGVGHCTGETISDSLWLWFHPMPVALAGDSIDACPNEPVYVFGGAYNYSGVLWESMGDGNFIDPAILNAEYVAGTIDKATGFVDLTLNAYGTDECITETDIDTVHVIFRPLPTANLSGWDTICEGDTAYIQLSLTGTPPWTIQLFDGLNTTTITGIDTTSYMLPVVPEVTVSYSVTGVSDQYCTGEVFSGSAIVIVNPAPDEFQIIATNGGIYCEGGTGVEIGIDGSQMGFEYQLLLNNQPYSPTFIGTGDTLIFGTFTPAGIYTVFAKNPATNCSIIFSDSLTVLVMPTPDVDFTADSSCLGDTTYFYLTGTDIGLVMEWTWDFGDGTWETYYSPVNPTHAYFGANTYTVTMYALDTNGCTKTVSHFVSVSSSPIANFGYTPNACVNSPVFFEDYSVTMNSSYIAQWNWDFGDGTDTTIYWPDNPNVSHTYTTSGVKTVILTVTTSGGCMDTVYHNIVINPTPIANFSYSTIRCINEPVIFNDLSDPNGGGTIISWYWNFDDPLSGSSNTSTTQNPTHTFGSPGTYNVLLIVTNLTDCTDSITKAVTISDAPVADFYADTACKGNPTTFTDLSSTSQGVIVSWEWDFGDGSPHLYTQTATHTYANSGIYTATLTVSNTAGCFDEISKQVLVTNGPTAGFIATNGNCAGSVVSFIDQSIPHQGYFVMWIWDFDDGTSDTINFPNPQNVDHIYSLPGTYNVVLTVLTSEGCMDSYSQPITIAPKPTADFTYPVENCEDFGVQFQDLSLPGGPGMITAWNWNFGDPTSGINNTSTLQNPIHTFLNAGNYDVTLIVTTLNGCEDTVVHTVPINSRPIVVFTADTSCFGNPTNFTDLSTTNSGTIIAWYWEFGDGVTSNLQHPTHTYSSPGIYQVTLTVTNSVNCYNDTTINVLVRDLPWPMFTSENNCYGTESYFFDQSFTTSGVITNWDWNFGDGNTDTVPDPVHIYDTSGTFYVTLIVTNSYGCQDSITKEHTVYQNPIAAFTYTNSYCPAGQVRFTDNSITFGANISSWYWIFENQAGSTLPNPIYTYSIYDTTYTVTLIIEDENGCSDTITDSVYVKPGFEFTFTVESECVGQPAQFTPVNLAQGDSLLSVHWRFGDPASGNNNFSTQYYPTHIYTNPGSHWVTLTATNSDYCIDSVFKEIMILEGAIADFTFDSLPHCDTTMAFRNLSVGIGVNIDTLHWNFGDTVITQVQPFPDTTWYRFPDFGYYNVTLTAISNDGCEDQITKSVLISCISAEFQHSDTTYCSGETVIFIDSSGPVNLISSWEWIFGDGSDTTYTQYSDSITHRYSTPGSYDVILVVSSFTAGSSMVNDTISSTIHIKAASYANFYANPVCYMDTTIFLNLTDSNGIPIVSSQWNFGDPQSGINNLSNLPDPVHFYSQAGTYQVTLNIENENGCQDSISQEVIIHHLPEAKFTVPWSCTRHNTQFFDESIQGDTLLSRWFWIFGDPHTPLDTSTLPDPYYTYYDAGEYTAFLKVSDDYGCSDTTSNQFIVKPSPISAFTIEEDIDGVPGRIQLYNHSIDAIEYEWDYGDGKKDFEENPAPHEYEKEGAYLIRLMTWSANDCSDTTSYNLDLLFKGLFIPNAFSPTNVNPNSKIFKPKGVNLKLYHIQVFDLWGTLLWESTHLDNDGRPTEGWDGTYNGKLMPQGVYMWKASATFVDGSTWEGNVIGKGDGKRIGTVALIR